MLVLAGSLPAGASGRRLGSTLYEPADTGVCSVPAGSLEASCTEAQAASGFDLTKLGGVITRWSVVSGIAPPATTGVKLRLRILRGTEAVPGAHSPYVDLPLDQPGRHVFASRIPIGESARIGLDLRVRGDGGGPAAAPLANAEDLAGRVGEWSPPLAGGEDRPPRAYHRDTELLLSASVERDRDRDGFGDRTQDRCPFDPRRRGPCPPDRVPPRIELDFAERQDFLDDGYLRVRVRPDEFVTVGVAGKLDLPDVTWGISGSETKVRGGADTSLFLWVAGDARRAAKRALTAGRPFLVRAYLYATDASGNESRRKHFVIKPPRS